MRLIQIRQNRAQAEAGGLRKDVDVRFLDKPRKGDYVLIHAGFAIQKVNPSRARETLRLVESIR